MHKLPVLVALFLLALAEARTAAADPKFEIDYKAAVEYGTGAGEKLLLDVATPKGAEGPRPALVFIHGGGWAAGNRSAHVAQIKDAAARGYVAVTVSYRFAPKHVFPAQVEDVKCAVRWLRAHAKELNVNPDRIGAIGVSAGGHLAMMLALMNKEDGLEGAGGWADQSSKVQAAVSFVGPTNFTVDFPPTTTQILKTWIGGTKDEKPEMYKKASPLTYVDGKDAPVLLYQGTTDVLVPFDQAVQMADALTKAKVKARVELLVGEGHGWGGKEMERTIRGMFEFLDGQLK